MEEPRRGEAELRALDAGVSLGDYLRVVIRRKWAVVIIFLTTVVLATLVSLRMPKVYQTSVTVKVSQRVVGQTILPTFYYDPFFLETEIEMIRSRALLTTVANRLGMTYRVAAAPPRLRDALVRAEFAEGTPAGDLVVTFVAPPPLGFVSTAAPRVRGARARFSKPTSGRCSSRRTALAPAIRS